jgi:tetratricopeptide (TPR) repeat protein
MSASQLKPSAQFPQSEAQTLNQPASFGVRPVALPLSLAAQMFTAFQGGKLSGEQVASTLLELTEQNDAGHMDAASLSELLTGQGRMQEAEALLRQALVKGRAMQGSEDPQVLCLQAALAQLLKEQGRLVDARRLFLATVDTQRRVMGAHHLDTLGTLEKLALLLMEQNDLRFAEPLLCEAVALRRRSQGDTHPDTLRALSYLAQLLRQQLKYTQAETLLRRNLGVQRELLGEGHADTLQTMGLLASLLEVMGNVSDAEALFVRTLVKAEAALGRSHHQALSAAYSYAGFLNNQGRANDARPYLTRALSVAQHAGDTDVFFSARLQVRLGESLTALTLFESAERHLTAGYDTLYEALGLTHPRTQRVLSDLITLYEAWGKPRKAAPFRRVHATCS